MNTSLLLQSAKSLGKRLLPVFFFFFSVNLHAQLVAFNAAASSGFGTSPFPASTLNANLTLTNGGLIRGSSVTTSGTPAGGCWGGSGGWGTTDAGSIYFTFTANTGYEVSLSSISARTRRSGSGPTNNNIEYSINGGPYVVIANWTTSSTSGTTGTPNSSVLSGIPALQNVASGTTIRFRMSFPGNPSNNFYLTGAAGTALVLSGSVVAVPTCTAPAGLAASSVTTNSADLNWNSVSGVSGYEYVIDQTAALPAGTGTAVTTNSYAAAGLNPGTVYYAHVRTDCGGPFSTWTTTSFTTAAGCVSPTITALTSNTAVCVGATLSLSVTAAGTALTYTWTGAGVFGSASTASTTVTNPGSSDYTVSISNACGTASAAVTVTVNPLPSVTSNSLVICAGSTSTLTASGAATYSWSTGQTAASTTVNPVSNSVYTVTGTDLNGCKASYTTAVAVNTLPAVSAGSPSICAGSTATLTATGADTYTWNATQAATSITVSPTATTVYTLTGTDLNGCMNTFTTQVTVNALPPVTANSPTVCSGSTTTLTAGGAATYTWNATQASNSMTVNPTGTTMYTVTGTDLNGCDNTYTTYVTVSALPTVIANAPSVCTGGTTTLTATGADTYTWNATQVSASMTVSPVSTTVYTVTGTDLAGCETTFTTQVTVGALPSVSANSPSVCAGGTTTLTATGADTYTWSTSQAATSITVSPASNTVYTVTGTDLGGCVNSFTTQVTMSAAPVMTINFSGSFSICAGGTATLTVSGVDSYTWSTGSNSSSVTVSPSTATVYTVSGNLSGCPVSVTQTVGLTVSSLPSVSITAMTSALCNTTNTVNLVGSPFGGTFSGAGITGNVFSPQAAGTGTFVVSYSYTGANACAGIAHTNIIVANCTGLEELSSALAFEVYPNPATDEIRLKFADQEPRSISIYSMSGVLVYSEKVQAMQHTLRINDLSRGLYILKVNGTEGQSSKKILLQ